MPSVLQRLHDSEINASVESFFDRVWTVKIGDRLNGFVAEATVDSYAEAERWLDAEARRLYPESRYAREAAPATEPPLPDRPAAT